MSDVTFVEGDTAPPVLAQLLQTSDNLPRDLTSVTTLRFQMRKIDDKRYQVNAVAAILNAADGRVRYIWAANDLSNPGDYLAQWEMTFVDGKVQTTEPPNTITVRRQ